MMILTVDKNFEVVVHQLLQHAGSAKEHLEIVKMGKLKPVPSVSSRKKTDREKSKKKTTQVLPFILYCYEHFDILKLLSLGIPVFY